MNGASEESIIRAIEMSPNGIVGKDIINMFATKNNRLQTKKFINTVSCFLFSKKVFRADMKYFSVE